MLTIDEENQKICYNGKTFSLYSSDAFELISALWLKMGWANKYSYQFSWMGRPIIQLPEDLIRVQEVIYQVKPTLIIETGIAHGGSLVFYATLLQILGKGRVIGIDIDIRKQNRAALEAHELFPWITLIEGSATDPKIVDDIYGSIRKEDKIMVILDSNHTYSHVLEELKLYFPLVSVGSYIVATDGIMKTLMGVPGSKESWDHDNPQTAVETFLKTNPQFSLDIPMPAFNQSSCTFMNTYWPKAWLKRIKA